MRSARLEVAGAVAGGQSAGISVLAGTLPQNLTDYYGTNADVLVTGTGTISGTSGLLLGRSPGNMSGPASASIDNAGSITATGGPALLTSTADDAFTSITNRTGGFIGGIAGVIATLNNAGVIDGGPSSAITRDPTSSLRIYPGPLTNSGTIRSDSLTATIANLSASQPIANSGSILNEGPGEVLSGDYIRLVNAVGGLITAAGSTAVVAISGLNLTNAGRITGDVIETAPEQYPGGSVLDSSAGTITGSVRFGGGADVLVAAYSPSSGLVTGISGTIDGGGGTDIIRLSPLGDLTLATPITLFTNFEALSIAPGMGATVTIDNGFSVPGTLRIGGAGRIVNRGTLATTGRSITPENSYTSANLINEGSITATGLAADDAAIVLSDSSRLENSGTITSSGGGVSSFSTIWFDNGGTISAATTAVSVNAANFVNTGMIRSSGGTALVLRGSPTFGQTNQGIIDGATFGLDLSSSLINIGTIRSAGTAVRLSGFGTFDNRAGGTVTGGTFAIATPETGFGTSASVRNAGTINGNIRLAGQAGDTGGRSFFALPGGILNGNLALGPRDRLITELANTGPGAFAGITGSVTATGSELIYRVRGDTITSLVPPVGFSRIGYDLVSPSKLTLTAAGRVAPLEFGGTGSVDLTADIDATGQPAIQTLPLFPDLPATALSIVSRGNISLDRTASTTFVAVDLNSSFSSTSSNSFTNAGTIRLSGAAPQGYAQSMAIFGGQDVVNSGTVNVAGGVAIAGAQRVTNSGNILQIAGGAAAQGVATRGSILNSGTIDVGGIAVAPGQFGLFNSNATIENSGTIASSGSTAILASGTKIINAAGGSIRAVAGQSAIIGSGIGLTNAGSIVGDVDLGAFFYANGSSDYIFPAGRSSSESTFVAAGGTLAGNLRFGSGSDVFVETGVPTGVSGAIDGGDGFDLWGHSRSSSGTVTLGAPGGTSFEGEFVEALGSNTIVTVNASAPHSADFSLVGDGAIVNQAATSGVLHTSRSFGYQGSSEARVMLASLSNEATIGGVDGIARSFTNSGIIGDPSRGGVVVGLEVPTGPQFSFNNIGTISSLGNSGFSIRDYPNDYDRPAVSLQRDYFGFADTITGFAALNNGGTINGGLAGIFTGYVELTNSGTISRDAEVSGALKVASTQFYQNVVSFPSVKITNTGTITSSGKGGAALLASTEAQSSIVPLPTIAVINSGTISASAVGEVLPFSNTAYVPSAAIGLFGGRTAISLTNLAGGLVSAPNLGSVAVAVQAPEGSFTLDNAGTIIGSEGVTVSGERRVVVGTAFTLPTGYLAGAVEVAGAATTIRNSGTITGSILLDARVDRIENLGTINGNVFLRGGDDIFIQYASAKLLGTVDGGDGLDALIVDATGGGTVNGDQFVNFESFTQRGSGNVTFTGNFNYDTIALAGGTITVGPGTNLRSNGATTITGSDADEAVVNYGTIAGRVALGGGSDSYTEGPNSSVGAIDGGEGRDTYIVALAGDRTGIGARTSFERLAVTGTGTLALRLDQSFEAVGLAGTGLDLQLGGFAIGGIDGSDGAEQVSVDGDVAQITLGAGNDALRIAGATLNGLYDGGSGTDSLTFTTAGPITLAGTAANFESIASAGNAFTVTGTLGSTGSTANFGDGAQALTIANGGRLLGSVDLGAGADSFRIAAGGHLLGNVSGGAGTDMAILDLTGDMAISGDALRDFETLTTTGGKTLTFAAGTARFDRIDASGSLNVANGAALSAAQVQFGGGNDRFAIAGSFTGSANGGAGIDALDLSGGNLTTPIAFQTIAGFETLGVSGGVSTIAGTAQFNRIDITGGRLIGLAGSVIAAPQTAVSTGATFGSAGTVVGDITVAGTLSPGASPGTMTVTGNVSLAAGSTTLFELTPIISDKLLVSGTLAIAGGATLTLTGNRPLTPGAALDLIVANGGISGSFGTINQPSTILGFLRESADRIQLFGQFNSAGFNPQVTATVNYVNGVLTGGQASAALIAAIPSLLTSGNATSGGAFTKLNPEAYASATQISIENGLTLAKAARSAANTNSDEAGAFSFAQGLGGWRSLNGDDAWGVSRAEINNYGVLGGLGFGTNSASVAGFVGYLNSRQRSPALGANTNADGITAGLIGHAAAGGFELSVLFAFDGGKARTSRSLPGGGRAASHYNLRGWIGDASLSYALPLNANWSLKPEGGLTYVSTRRAGVTETGGGAFSLAVARRLSHATFVDGALTLSGGASATATFHPWASAGVRHQLAGRGTFAAASFVNAPGSFSVIGVRRQATLATVATGVTANLTQQLDLYAAYRGEFGKDGTGASLTGGLRLRF